MSDTRVLRLSLYAGCALLLIALSLVPLMQVVSLGRLYFAAATRQFYTPLNERAVKTHDFFGTSLQLLRPAVPYLLLFVSLQVGAAYALTRSALVKKRPFMWGSCLTIGMTLLVAVVLWIRLTR